MRKFPRLYKLIIYSIYALCLAFGVFLLLYKSRYFLINANRYLLFFPSLELPLLFLLSELLIFSLLLYKKPKLLNLLKQKFNREIFVFIVVFLLIIIFLSTNKFLIWLFCISPIIFPLVALLVLYKSPDRYIDRFKMYITNFTILFVSILLLLVSLEVYLHIAKPSFLGLDLQITGNLTDYTARGYFTEKTFDKKRGVFRILGFGDSFAICLRDVKKNYYDFLQKRLDDKHEKDKVEVINAGMQAMGPGYYFRILDKFGDLIKPDLVLVSFFIGNDFHETYFRKHTIGSYIYESSDTKERILGYFRFKNFWLCQILNKKLTLALENRRKEKELREGIAEEEGFFSRKSFLRIERDRMWICEKDTIRILEDFWARNSKVMLDMKEWCDRRNIKFMIAITPDQFQVEADLRKEIFGEYDLNEDFLDIYYPNKMLSDFLKQYDIHVVDLLETFQEKAGLEELYLVADTHWNEKGNKLAAEIIADYIEEQGLININDI